MTRSRVLLWLALAAGVPLTGCGDNKSGPSLDSDNRNERLQAVRHAQDKWGAHKRAQTADQEGIVGRWNHPWTDSSYYRFNPDGTYANVALLGSVEGTYRVLPGNVIELNHTIFGRCELRYHLVGDRLELNDGKFVTYQRAAE